MATTGTDIDALTEAELLVLPQSIIPSGSLTKFWALHAAILQKENADELARELTGASRSHRMMGAGETREDAEDRERRLREAWTKEARLREERLFILIEAREREIEERRQEIDRRAICLADGRRVYVDGDGYRDADGRRLEGRDRAEAAGKRQGSSATWAEREENERQWREAERLRHEIEENRGRAPHERDRNLEVYEQQFEAKKAQAKASLETGPPDQSAAYGDCGSGLTAAFNEGASQITVPGGSPEMPLQSGQSRSAAAQNQKLSR